MKTEKAQKLNKRILQLLQEYSHQNDTRSNQRSIIDDDFNDLSDDIVKEAISQMQPEWVNVEDRLPEVGEFVLTYVPEINMICRDQYREFEALDNKRDFVYRGVTHWMPLPPTPNKVR